MAVASVRRGALVGRLKARERSDAYAGEMETGVEVEVLARYTCDSATGLGYGSPSCTISPLRWLPLLHMSAR